jgi:hypothetical protein
MELAQLTLTYTFNFFYYFFSSLFIFAFLSGWLMAEPEVKALPKSESSRQQAEPALPSISNPADIKLSFKEVCRRFTTRGLTFQRSRSGHYRYRVIPAVGSSCRFKTLQEASEWLTSRDAGKKIAV